MISQIENWYLLLNLLLDGAAQKMSAHTHTHNSGQDNCSCWSCLFLPIASVSIRSNSAVADLRCTASPHMPINTQTKRALVPNTLSIVVWCATLGIRVAVYANAANTSRACMWLRLNNTRHERYVNVDKMAGEDRQIAYIPVSVVIRVCLEKLRVRLCSCSTGTIEQEQWARVHSNPPRVKNVCKAFQLSHVRWVSRRRRDRVGTHSRYHKTNINYSWGVAVSVRHSNVLQQSLRSGSFCHSFSVCLQATIDTLHRTSVNHILQHPLRIHINKHTVHVYH